MTRRADQYRYSVYVEFDVPNPSPDVFASLHEELGDYAPAAGPAENGNLSVRMFIDADNPVDAAARGVEHAQAAAIKQLIPPTSVVGFTVMTYEEFNRQLRQPYLPKLAGRAEASEILGISGTRVRQLLDDGSLANCLVQELAAGPVFLADQLHAFREHEHDAGSGRRRANLPLSAHERAMLEVFAAAASSAEAPPSSSDHVHASGAIEEVLPNGKLRVHLGPDDSPVAKAVQQLISHRLITTRHLYSTEIPPGHEGDVVVTVTRKGHRHAGIPAVATKETA
ncbi:hypothetical protein [Streptomyces europaeiscabiei]|uniref:hypothetical protein n=1 Tax=Streptomyces europaeiscabiei TaxID=146819 RepID=UPI0038F70872